MLANCRLRLHNECMAVQITIRDVSNEVRDELAARAARSGKSMQEYLKQELERIAMRPSLEDWLDRVRGRKELAPRTVAADVIVTHRDDHRARCRCIGSGCRFGGLRRRRVMVRASDRRGLSGCAGVGDRRGSEHPASARAWRTSDRVGGFVCTAGPPRSRDRADAHPPLTSTISRSS